MSPETKDLTFQTTFWYHLKLLLGQGELPITLEYYRCISQRGKVWQSKNIVAAFVEIGSGGDFVQGKVATALFVPWLIAITIFVMVYKNMLVSFLCTQVATPLVTSLDDLIEKPELKFVTLRYSGIDEEWMVR